MQPKHPLHHPIDLRFQLQPQVFVSIELEDFGNEALAKDLIVHFVDCGLKKFFQVSQMYLIRTSRTPKPRTIGNH